MTEDERRELDRMYANVRESYRQRAASEAEYGRDVQLEWQHIVVAKDAQHD